MGYQLCGYRSPGSRLTLHDKADRAALLAEDCADDKNS